jgi:hypothetical protein
MAYAITGGASRQKVDLDAIIETMLDELNAVNDSGKTQSEKTKLYKRIADKVKTALHDDGRKKDTVKLALTTYKRYMTTVRNAIKAAGYVHHSLNSKTAIAGTLPRAIKDFPEYAEMLETLRSEPAVTMGARVHEILKTIQEDKGNKNRNAAYKAVKTMKTDHEVIYHLTMDDVQRADYGDQHAAALDEKKTNTVRMVYADIMAVIHDGLKQERSYSRRAFALALASGRRAVEVIYTARFEKTGDNTVMFTGQAKKRAGIDAESFEIFTLVPADEFLAAFESFRKMEEIAKIHADFKDMTKDDRNTAINARTAKTMNESAKAVMDDNQRSFKDSRAIYARICIDTHWDKTIDEDAFVTRLLGHDNNSAQAHYKQFIVDYSAAAQAATAETAAQDYTPKSAQITAVEHDPKEFRKVAKELSGARAALETFVSANPKRHGMLNYHNLVEEWAAANPSKQITFSALVKREKGGIGGNRNSVKDYLTIISAELEAYNAKRNG